MPEPLLQCSYMPGDSFAIAAYLALTPTQKLILLKDTTLVDDKHKFISGLYKDTGVAAQVTEIDLPTLWRPKLTSSPAKEVYRLWSGKQVPASPAAYVNPEAPRQEVIRAILQAIFDVDKQWPRGVTTVTGWLASKVEGNCDQRLTELLNKWQIATLTQGWAKDFDLFLSAKGLTKLKKSSLVLWSRQSGKKQGAHLELDSSFKGIRQLVKAFQAKSKGVHSVILVGDDKRTAASTKLQEVATKRGCAYLGEFWSSPEWKSKFDENRIAQLAFWVYLNSKHSKLVHLGMRSGNLEAMSLLKMPAIYLEPVGSRSGERMTAFEKAGIGYERLQIAHSPGLTGRWADDYEKARNLPAKTGDFAQAVGREARAIKDWKLDKTSEAIRNTAKARDMAWNEGKKREAGKLAQEVRELQEDKRAILGTDYTASAKANVKEFDPDDDDYTRSRGFEPGDIDKIVDAVLTRL